MGIFDWLGSLFRRKDAVAWATEARERLGKNKLHRALLSAERAVEQRPDDPDLLILRSEILQRSNLHERSLEDLLQALEHDPGRAATLLERIEELQSSAPQPERVWVHTWRVYAEQGEYKHARDRVARIAAKGDAAGHALREQCAAMLTGTGDRRAALFGLAFLARERGDGDEAVARVLEATGSGGRADLAFADLFIQEMLSDRTDFASALRALVVIRVLLGNEDQARDLVVSLCRREAESGVDLLEELRGDERRVAAFALGLMVDMEKASDVPVRLSQLLATGLLEDRREDEAARVVLRAVRREPASGESLLPLAVKLMKSHGGLDALESQARCAAAAGDVASVFLTLHEFVEKDPERALGVLEVLAAADSGSGEGALLTSRARAGLGEHQRATADLRRWALGSGGVGAKEAIAHVRAASQAHADVPAYGLLLVDLLQATEDISGAGTVLLELVRRHPDAADQVSARALSVIEESSGPAVFPARLAAARSGLIRSEEPGVVLAQYRNAQGDAPAREADLLAELESASAWVADCEPVEIFQCDLVLRAGRVDEGLARLEEIVVRNPARGSDAQAVLRAFQEGAGAGDSRALMAEHRVRLLLRDYEGCVGPLRRVADLDEARRVAVLAALDAVIGEAPTCRSAHRAGVEIALRLNHTKEKVLERLEALLDIPTPPRDTAYVTRRTLGVQGDAPVVSGHRLLARCHLFARRLPLCVEEVRRMVERDATTRGEAVRFLQHVLDHDSNNHEARFLTASIQAALGSVDDARDALREARPRSDKVFAAWQALVEAFPSHLGVRLDLIDAQLHERQVDAALEEISRLLNVPGIPLDELVKRVEQMLDVAPEYGPALYGLADVHHAAKNWVAEIEACRRILRLAPHEAEQILVRLDVILAEAPDCLDASLEVISLVDLHQDLARVGKEARHALDLVTDAPGLERIADTLLELEREFDRDVAYREALAESLRRAGRRKKSVQAYGLLLALAPERATVISEGVRLLADGEGPETNSALEVLFESVLREGNADAACETANLLLERRPDDVTGAYRKFSRVLEAHEESHEAADGKARTAVLKGDPDNAVKALLHDLRFHPDRRREVGQSLGALREQFPDCAAVPLARVEYIHLLLNLLGDAADDLEAVLAIDPSLHRTVLRLADTILERDPHLPRGHRARGKALVAAGDPTAATAAFVRMAELHPDRYGDALEGLDAVLVDAPGHVEARYRRGRMLLALDRPKEAGQQAESLVASLRPGEEDEYRALELLAEARERLELFDDALAALRDAATRHPAHTEVVPLIRANRVVALEHRAALLRNAPDEDRPDADMDLAETLLALGKPESALAAVGPIPEKGKALARWKVIRGRAFRAIGRGAAALSELEDALRVRGIQDGKSDIGIQALYTAGRAYLDTGEKVKAIRRMEQVAGVDPHYGRVREALDIIYDEDRRELDRPLEFTVPLEVTPEPKRV